ncbi:anthranilate phosphoribosyltransferase [Pseudoscardovia radai]|uniref:anthranilate phosphoribosyltransferase n=1 Tax=Pseudoscardovia radai TaxID=987066 RepID=UPI003994D2CC
MAEFTWKSILTQLVVRHEHLTEEQSEWYINDLMDGNADPVPVAAVLATQQQLGLTADEVAGAAQAMVSHAIPLKLTGETTDIVGTGGDGFATVNISTTGSIIAAAAGVKIAKHGNRAASSKSGAADCLEALGIPLDLTPEQVAAVGEKTGITFAFARTFHPAMRFVGPIRAKLGVPCVFNLLGPITNPAKPAHFAIGSADKAMSPIIADVLAKRGASGMVFTSSEGMDELAPTGPVSLWLVRDGKVETASFDPLADLGLTKVTVEDLRGDTPEYNAQVARDVISGKQLPCTSTILLNAAAAIVVDGHLLSDQDAPIADRFREAYDIAKQTVASGKAEAKLDEWIAAAKAAKA